MDEWPEDLLGSRSEYTRPDDLSSIANKIRTDRDPLVCSMGTATPGRAEMIRQFALFLDRAAKAAVSWDAAKGHLRHRKRNVKPEIAAALAGTSLDIPPRFLEDGYANSLMDLASFFRPLPLPKDPSEYQVPWEEICGLLNCRYELLLRLLDFTNHHLRAGTGRFNRDAVRKTIARVRKETRTQGPHPPKP